MKMSAEHVMGKKRWMENIWRFFISTISGEASVTSCSFLSHMLTIQLPGGNDQNRIYATL